MFKIFALYGIPRRIVDAIWTLYANTTATVIFPDGETGFFEFEAGVL